MFTTVCAACTFDERWRCINHVNVLKIYKYIYFYVLCKGECEDPESGVCICVSAKAELWFKTESLNNWR